MFSSISIRTRVVGFFIGLCIVGTTFASENTVVVIPMGADATTETVSSYNQITSDIVILAIVPTQVNFAYIGVPSSGMLFARGTVSVKQDNGNAVSCLLSIDDSFEDKFQSIWKPPAGTDLISTLTSLNQFKINSAGVQTVKHLCRVDNRGTATAIRGNLTLFFMPD